jgi:hypothetical protein
LLAELDWVGSWRFGAKMIEAFVGKRSLTALAIAVVTVSADILTDQMRIRVESMLGLLITNCA